MCSESFLRASRVSEIGNEKGWRDVVVGGFVPDLVTLTLVSHGLAERRAPTLMSVVRRDAAALISIGALLPVGPLRTGNQRVNGKVERWKSRFEEASRE